MNMLLESLRSALESIRAHGFRSVLTSLGIIIGVTSVIAVVSIVQGLSYTINAQFEGLGGNSLTIQSYTPFKRALQGHRAKLRDRDIDKRRFGEADARFALRDADFELLLPGPGAVHLWLPELALPEQPIAVSGSLRNRPQGLAIEQARIAPARDDRLVDLARLVPLDDLALVCPGQKAQGGGMAADADHEEFIQVGAEYRKELDSL